MPVDQVDFKGTGLVKSNFIRNLSYSQTRNIWNESSTSTIISLFKAFSFSQQTSCSGLHLKKSIENNSTTIILWAEVRETNHHQIQSVLFVCKLRNTCEQDWSQANVNYVITLGACFGL